jgi:hypothetical protein
MLRYLGKQSPKKDETMWVKIFVLGRPGSSKSHALRIITEHIKQQHNNWSVHIISDYKILWQMFILDSTDNNKQKKFRPTEHGGFEVIDFSALDEASQEVERIARTMFVSNDNAMIFIEFARDDYKVALGQFTREFLRDAYFLLVEADVETCIRRIHDRIVQPTSMDDHFVSDKIMRNYYSLSNKEFMLVGLKQDYGIEKEFDIVENVGSLDDFTDGIHRFINLILEKEL